MKNILFPYSEDYQSISKYWWHRALIIVFAVAVFLAGYSVWRSFLQSEEAGYSSCNMLQIAMYAHDPSLTAGKELQLGKLQCIQNDQIHPVIDFGIGVFVSVITFYMLQFLYYKTIGFIFNEKDCKGNQQH